MNGSINFSNLYEPVKNVKLSIPEIMADVCTQIDAKIILGLFFIFTFYVSVKFISPVCRHSLLKTYPAFKVQVSTIMDYYDSFTETLGLGSIILIIVFAYQIEPFEIGYKIWGATLILFAILSGIYKYRLKKS